MRKCSQIIYHCIDPLAMSWMYYPIKSVLKLLTKSDRVMLLRGRTAAQQIVQCFLQGNTNKYSKILKSN